jgi:putative membrane protein
MSAGVMRSELSRHARLPAALLLLFGVVCLVTGISPSAGHVSWLLEVAPGLLGVFVLVVTYRRFPMSHLVYGLVLAHFVILAYGGFYTYERAPLGNWAKAAFHLARNDYDRVGHFALGAFPALTIREVLLRKTPLERGGWLTFLVLAVVLAIAAFWELIEWWVTLLTASDVGQAFLGTQGDVWDAQWDMLWALIGAAVSLPLLSGAHDRSMRRVPAREAH